MNRNLKELNDYHNLLNDTLRDSYHQVVKIYEKIPKAYAQNLFINIRTGYLMRRHSFNSSYYYSSNENIPICWHFTCGGKTSLCVIKKLFKTYFYWLDNYAKNQSIEILKELIKNELEQTSQLIEGMKYDNSREKTYKLIDSDSDHSSFVEEKTNSLGFYIDSGDANGDNDHSGYEDDDSDDLRDFIVSTEEEEEDEEEKEEEDQEEEDQEEEEQDNEEENEVEPKTNAKDEEKEENDKEENSNELESDFVDINNCDGISFEFKLNSKPSKLKKFRCKRKRSSSTISLSLLHNEPNSNSLSNSKKGRIISDEN